MFTSEESARTEYRVPFIQRVYVYQRCQRITNRKKEQKKKNKTDRKRSRNVEGNEIEHTLREV